MASRQKATQQPTGTSYWEWVVAALGVVLVVGAVGYFIWYGITRPGGPPELTIRQLADIRQVENSYLVQVEVANHGHSTAAGVEIAGSLVQGGQSIEDSGATIDYVPQQSRRKAYFQFTRDPRLHTLQLRVEGMAQP